MDRTEAETEEAGLTTEGAALQALLDHSREFRAFLRRQVESEAAAEDLFQVSLLRALGKAGDLRQSESLVPWFYRILRNLLTDHYRSRASEARKSAAFAEETAALGEDLVPPPDEAIEAEVCACFKRLLPVLKPEYAEVLRRADLEGESPSEIARSLNVTPGNLAVRLHRARQSLKKSLEMACGICSRHGCLDCSCSSSA